MQEQVILPDKTKHFLSVTSPVVSNIVTVTYLEEPIVNTEWVFKYLPIRYVPEAKGETFKKHIPVFGHYDCILSVRYANKARGLRKAKKQMEQICSMDVSLDDLDLNLRKSVHCKLAGDTCHVTGAKSFEQGMRATNIILREVQKTQKLIDEYRLGKRNKDIFYDIYREEKTEEEIDELCLDMLKKSEMLCIRSIQIREAVTSNGVYEIKANFKFFLKTLCEVAHHKESFCVDYANWNRSTIASISIPGRIGDRKFYHRAQINSKGSIRLSSPCDIANARDGYQKLCKFLFKVWNETRVIFENRLKMKEIEEGIHRGFIEQDFDEFWKVFAETSAAEVSGNIDISNFEVLRKAEAVYGRLGLE